ncbi:hypothetical protein L7Q78_39700, partial [Achromobacter xylosoxidans]|nr:hypothetical protein [Achromobacter xylosoxidans]
MRAMLCREARPDPPWIENRRPVFPLLRLRVLAQPAYGRRVNWPSLFLRRESRAQIVDQIADLPVVQAVA